MSSIVLVGPTPGTLDGPSVHIGPPGSKPAGGRGVMAMFRSIASKPTTEKKKDDDEEEEDEEEEEEDENDDKKDDKKESFLERMGKVFEHV